MLYKYTLKLSEYDFTSEVDVNILGHIFENSLNEIEEVQTQLEENPNEVKTLSEKKMVCFTLQNTLPNTLPNTLLKTP